MSVPLSQIPAVRRQGPGVEVTQRLLQFLLSGELQPGNKIPSERDLAMTLGVGRAAVREALKSLSLLGLLDQRVGDGTYLTGSTSELLPQVIEWGLMLGGRSLEDLIEARRHLETMLAGLAAERRSADDLAHLEELVNEMSSAGGDLDRYVSADIAFHLGLAQAAGNSILAGIIANIESLLRAWALRVLRTAGETQTSLAMHKPILDAVKNADGEAAQIAMAAHSDRAARRLRASLVPQGTMPKTQRKVPSRAPSLRRSPRTP